MKANNIAEGINNSKLRFKKLVSSTSIGSAVSLRAAMLPLPNIEPVMLFTLAGALVYGPLYGFFIGFMAMAISDIIIKIAGVWTIYTAISYGLVGFAAGLIGILKPGIKKSRASIVLLAFTLTIIYDIMTTAAWAFSFMVPLPVAFVSLIPFSLIHVAGNCALAFIFAPSIIGFMSRVSEPSASSGLFKKVSAARRYVLEGITGIYRAKETKTST